MHRTRTASHAPARLALAIAAIVLASGVSGCHWFGKKDELYTQSVESRPLEVPPDLDRPSADRAMALPSAGGSATASGVATAPERNSEAAAGSPGRARTTAKAGTRNVPSSAPAASFSRNSTVLPASASSESASISFSSAPIACTAGR